MIPTFGSPEWQEWRRTRIGASEIAMLAGLSPHGTALDLFNRKIGLAPDIDDTPAMEQGRLFEAPIAHLYMAHEPRHILVGDGRTSLQHPGESWAIATPDRFVMEENLGGPIAIAQIKATGWYAGAEWGEPGTDEIPRGYWAQVQQELAVTGQDLCLVIRFTWGRPLAVYPVRYDPEAWVALAEIGRRFVEEHLKTGRPPAMDGSDAAWTYLASRGAQRERLRPAEEEEARLAEKVMKCAAARKRLEEREAALRARLAEAIGEDRGVAGAGWTAKWEERKAAEVPAHVRKASKFLTVRAKKGD